MSFSGVERSTQPRGVRLSLRRVRDDRRHRDQERRERRPPADNLLARDDPHLQQSE